MERILVVYLSAILAFLTLRCRSHEWLLWLFVGHKMSKSRCLVQKMHAFMFDFKHLDSNHERTLPQLVHEQDFLRKDSIWMSESTEKYVSLADAILTVVLLDNVQI